MIYHAYAYHDEHDIWIYDSATNDRYSMPQATSLRHALEAYLNSRNTYQPFSIYEERSFFEDEDEKGIIHTSPFPDKLICWFQKNTSCNAPE